MWMVIAFIAGCVIGFMGGIAITITPEDLEPPNRGDGWNCG